MDHTRFTLSTKVITKPNALVEMIRADKRLAVLDPYLLNRVCAAINSVAIPYEASLVVSDQWVSGLAVPDVEAEVASILSRKFVDDLLPLLDCTMTQVRV